MTTQISLTQISARDVCGWQPTLGPDNSFNIPKLVPATLKLYLNGLRQAENADYTVDAAGNVAPIADSPFALSAGQQPIVLADFLQLA